MLIGRQLSKNRFQNWHLKVLKVFYQSVIWSPFLSYKERNLNMLPLLNHGLQKQCSFQEEQRINWRQRIWIFCSHVSFHAFVRGTEMHGFEK